MDSGCDHDHQVVNLSGLSVCTSSCMYRDDSTAEFHESLEGDADDEEFSDEMKMFKLQTAPQFSSSSDSEPRYYSLPATPPRNRRKSRSGLATDRQFKRAKDYASENEAKRCGRHVSLSFRRRRRMEGNRLLLDRAENYNWMHKKKGDNTEGIGNGYSGGVSEVMLIARPKGGRRSMCMDLEEVKACRDLGFELEHGRMLEMPSRVSISADSTFDASSGGNSPTAHCHISSPGDDPRDVKARLKRWAQAVALASTSRLSTRELS